MRVLYILQYQTFITNVNTADVTVENLNLRLSSLGISHILLSLSHFDHFTVHYDIQQRKGQKSKNETPTYHLEVLIPVSPFSTVLYTVNILLCKN